MKRLFFAIALLGPAILSGQSFEGVIRFSMEYSGDQADMIKAQAPSANVITIKGNNSKVVSEGGIMGAMIGNIITKSDEKTTYFVNDSQKSVYKAKSDEVKNDKGEDAVATKESGTATILGYKCQKYKVVMNGTDNYVWATTDIKVGEYSGKVAYKGVDGVILKQELNMNEQGMSIKIIMTCVSFDKKSVSDNEFEIPTTYKVTEGIPPLLKMQMGK